MNWKIVALTLAMTLTTGTTAMAQKKDKTKKPETRVEETHPDRDHQVEADDVYVDREKTQYGGASGNKRFNVRFSPIHLLLGVAHLELDFKLAPKFTIGPVASYVSVTYGSSSAIAYGLGARANFYPTSEALNDDGLYLAPIAQYIKAEAKNNSGTATVSGMNYTLLAGYQWMWDSFNIGLGGGFQVTSLPNKITYKNNATGVTEEHDFAYRTSGLALEFSLGFAF